MDLRYSRPMRSLLQLVPCSLAHGLLTLALLSGVLPSCAYIDKGTLDARLDPDEDGSPWPDDCAPDDASVFPGATELCDGVDQDCDGEVDEEATDGLPWYTDADGDSHGDPLASATACEAPTDAVASSDDCDDTDDGRFPGATELCDGVDQDCDDLIDEGATDLASWYRDADGDGIGDTSDSLGACTAPEGYVAESGDCDDTDDTIGGQTTWYTDSDDDGYGDPSTAILGCEAPANAVSDGSDCDDSDAAYHPGAPEADCTDPADYNCDGSTGEDDKDEDGWSACTECDDSDEGVSPDAIEVCDSVDNDCSGVVDDNATDALIWYADADEDGFGDPTSTTAACEAPTGYVGEDTDCNDTRGDISPDGVEVCDAAETDEDCDGLAEDADPDVTGTSDWYSDEDGDGYGDPATATAACEAPPATVADGRDCDDADNTTYPTAPEACDDPADRNCDGATGYTDGDGDGWAACIECDDTDGAINPDVTELCDGVDNDCSGAADDEATDALLWYEDSDGDGFGEAAVSTTACEAPLGYVGDFSDCDDTRGDISPDGVEICDAAETDEDCDGLSDDDDSDVSAAGQTLFYLDADSDSYGDDAATVLYCQAPGGWAAIGGDCDDALAAVNPAATETCSTTYDDDCDGTALEPDADGCTAWYSDGDGDGYGDGAGECLCDASAAYSAASDGDCDDSAVAVHPGATEVCDTANQDEDCDGWADDADTSTSDTGKTDYYIDSDGDSYGKSGATAVGFCDPTSGYSVSATDCDDSESSTYPGATELVGDGADQSCDGFESCYVDADDDGYRETSGATITTTTITCLGSGAALGTDPATDCDDSLAAVHPGATEVVGDGINGDCSLATSSTGLETCYVDGDGDGYVESSGAMRIYSSTDADCGDAGEGSSSLPRTDCDDGDGAVNPGEVEVCANGVDDDCDESSGACAPSGRSLSDADAEYTGEAAGDLAGAYVSNAGDVNNDGFEDIVVGAERNDGSGMDAGAAYLILGASFPTDSALGSANARYRGEAAYDYAGASVSAAGDVNNDGFGDLIIGAYANSESGAYAGAAYLVLGDSLPSDLSLGDADAKFSGKSAGDLAGISVSAAGDTNGDGYGDLVVGAHHSDDGGTWAGAAYLIYGSKFPNDLDLGSADAQYTGKTDYDYAGCSVSTAGDVDADGLGDLVIGAMFNDDGASGSEAGAAYLILGGGSTGTTGLSAADAQYLGESSGDYAGMVVSTAGDVNGDGFGDIIIGAGGDDDGGAAAGAAYLLLGSAAPGDVDLGAADVKYTGGSASLNAGRSVSEANDVDGDGFDDIIVGAPYYDYGGADVGIAYLVLGSASPASISLGSADAGYTGEAPDDAAGFSVSGAGDVNGDGRNDILVGSNDGGHNAGFAYLILGSGL
jgi:hypothetical protein